MEKKKEKNEIEECKTPTLNIFRERKRERGRERRRKNESGKIRRGEKEGKKKLTKRKKKNLHSWKLVKI